jgi:hypothetical protein
MICRTTGCIALRTIGSVQRMVLRGKKRPAEGEKSVGHCRFSSIRDHDQAEPFSLKGPPHFQGQGGKGARGKGPPELAQIRGPSRATEATKRPSLSAPMRSVAQEDAGEL